MFFLSNIKAGSLKQEHDLKLRKSVKNFWKMQQTKHGIVVKHYNAYGQHVEPANGKPPMGMEQFIIRVCFARMGSTANNRS